MGIFGAVLESFLPHLPTTKFTLSFKKLTWNKDIGQEFTLTKYFY